MNKKVRTRLGRPTGTDKHRTKLNSYKFYFLKGNDKVRICKRFYLNTLDVCQKRVINYHKSKDASTGIPQPIIQGKHIKRKMPQEDADAVREHKSRVTLLSCKNTERISGKRLISHENV